MKYICTHTDFNAPESGEYIILSNKPLNNTYQYPVVVADNKYKPLQYAYAEGYMIYDIYDKTNDDWVAINHYRRYIDYPDSSTVLPVPFTFNMETQYGGCHNIEDLRQIEDIINTYYPDYKLDYEKLNLLYPCNMFQMNREDFNRYVDFNFGVLSKFNSKNNLQTDDDVKEYVKQYNKRDLNYQSRLQGFLMERIGTIFFVTHFNNKQIQYLPIHLTGNKIIL